MDQGQVIAKASFMIAVLSKTLVEKGIVTTAEFNEMEAKMRKMVDESMKQEGTTES